MNAPQRFLVVKQKDGVRQAHGTAILLTEGNLLWITSHPLDLTFGVRYFLSADGRYSPAIPILDSVEDAIPIQGMEELGSKSPYIYRLALGEPESGGEG